MGTETPTNFPFCNAGPVFGTKFPRRIPINMARKIHSARNRSSNPRLLNADVFDVSTFSSLWPFSASELDIGCCEDSDLETRTSSEGRAFGSDSEEDVIVTGDGTFVPRDTKKFSSSIYQSSSG